MFRRDMYVAPPPSDNARFWRCDDCFALSSTRFYDYCRLCQKKSPQLLAREDQEAKQRLHEKQLEEQARLERERTGKLEHKDILYAFEQGFEMPAGLGPENALDPAPSRRNLGEKGKDLLRFWARTNGHEPEF